jgi:hypothetical protein
LNFIYAAGGGSTGEFDGNETNSFELKRKKRQTGAEHISKESRRGVLASSV